MSGRKMSKSTGNVLTVRDALAHYSASELRLFLLGTHYRRDMDLSGMETASKRLRRMRHLAEAISHGSNEAAAFVEPGSLSMFEAAMNDDIDTPRAISWIERTLERGTKERDNRDRKAALVAAVAGARILGVDLLDNSSKA
jgi:cysteinyl-tRNA synthetase